MKPDAICRLCGCALAGMPHVAVSADIHSPSGRLLRRADLAAYHLPCVMDRLASGDVPVGSLLEELDGSGLLSAGTRLRLVK